MRSALRRTATQQISARNTKRIAKTIWYMCNVQMYLLNVMNGARNYCALCEARPSVRT